MHQKIGVVIALAVFAAVGLLLFFNLQPSSTPGASSGPSLLSPSGARFREYPIGETEHSGMQIAAVWLPPIQMAGMDLPQDADVIHLEADIHALEGNINGFGRGAWIPYLTVRYEIIPLDPDKEPIRGEFMPMVAKDGPHYGATLRMPGPGKYRLIYKLEPPSMGRHSDPITGVAPWWEPFQVEFEFDYPGSGQPTPSNETRAIGVAPGGSRFKWSSSSIIREVASQRRRMRREQPALSRRHLAGIIPPLSSWGREKRFATS